jgi:hypothetical protein
VRHLLAHLLQRRLADQLGDLPLEVVVGGLLLRVQRWPLGQQLDEQVGQQLDLVPFQRADRHHLGGVDQLAGGHQLVGHLLLARRVGLGHHHDDRRRHLAQPAGDEGVAGAHRLVGGDAEDDHVDVGQGVADDVVEPAAEQAARLVQARGVDEDQLPVGPVDDAAEGVPGGLRAVADDADLLADQRIGQGGLARVRPAHQGGEAAAERRLLRCRHAVQSPTAHRRPRSGGTFHAESSGCEDGRMAGRARRGQGEPPAVRAARDRERHISQVTSYGFFTPRRPKRSVTVTPAPLRYWQYDPARAWLILLVAAAVAAWLSFLAWRDGSAAAADEAPLVIGLGLLVLLGSTGRLTVSDHGLSTDIAGLRQTSSFGVVTRGLVLDVRRGDPEADWPRAKRRGGLWLGRTRVAVRHLAPDGETERAFTVWVRDPEAFADALDHPLD